MVQLKRFCIDRARQAPRNAGKPVVTRLCTLNHDLQHCHYIRTVIDRCFVSLQQPPRQLPLFYCSYPLALFVILMDFDEIAEASHEASCDAWFDLYNSLQGAPLSKFVSKFRDNQQCWQQSIDCGSLTSAADSLLRMGYSGCYAFQCQERLCTLQSKSDVNLVRKSTFLDRQKSALQN